MEYIVTFKDWNGTTLKTQTIQSGNSATAPSNPTRTGYTFTGWDKSFTNVTSNMTVTAQYKINSYTVKFVNWNSTVLKTQTVNYGSAATAPSSPSRTGYTFTGWDKTFTNVTSNMTITAQYKINSYKVSFNSNGGSAVGAKTVNYNSKVTKPTDPTRVGYTFEGWYTDSSLKTAYNFNSAVTKAFTLYAKWTQDQTVSKVTIYRLYNRYSGEHFYTSNSGERDNLKRLGWVYEDIGWVAPKSSKTPVHRL